VVGDGRGVEDGHAGDPHPFVGGRMNVDVVDPDCELDEAEAPGPKGPPGQRRPQRDDHVDGGPPPTKRASNWPCPTTSITARPARPAGQCCGFSDQA